MYINFMLEENRNNNILRWLMLITLLVAMMIIIGGLTRLTDSGLSITKWDLFSGIIPPLTLENWEKAFFYINKYLTWIRCNINFYFYIIIKTGGDDFW